MTNQPAPTILATVPAASVEREMLLLVDFENVPHFSLADAAKDEDVSIIIYVGASQKSIPLELVATAQPWGSRIQWLRIDASGPNALDFFIACKLGQVLETARHTVCIVLSKDKGFDPLIRHLNSLGLKCERVERIGPSPKTVPKAVQQKSVVVPQSAKPTTPTNPSPATAAKLAAVSAKPAPPKTVAATKVVSKPPATPKIPLSETTKDVSAAYERILTTLRNSAKARPAKRATLKKHIAAMFQNNISDTDVERIISLLVATKRISLNVEKVTYKL